MTKRALVLLAAVFMPAPARASSDPIEPLLCQRVLTTYAGSPKIIDLDVAFSRSPTNADGTVTLKNASDKQGYDAKGISICRTGKKCRVISTNIASLRWADVYYSHWLDNDFFVARARNRGDIDLAMAASWFLANGKSAKHVAHLKFLERVDQESIVRFAKVGKNLFAVSHFHPGNSNIDVPDLSRVYLFRSTGKLVKEIEPSAKLFESLPVCKIAANPVHETNP